MERSLSYRATADDGGLTVDALLRRRLYVSSTLIRALKQVDEGITLNGAHANVTQTVAAGDVLRILTELPGSRLENVVPQQGTLSIVYEDEWMLVLDKPAGLPVHPSRGHPQDTLANYVMGYMGASFVFRAINRLDKGTSGLLCVAKNKYAAEQLGQMLARGEIKRTYQAVLCGTGLPPTGTIDLPIARREGYGIMREVNPACGARAVTHYRVLQESAGHTLAEIRLETGRTHQIRVHFATLGYPVAGDFMYGTELPWLDGHALHASRLDFAPGSLAGCRFTGPGERSLSFAAPPPAYFGRLMGAETNAE